MTDTFLSLLLNVLQGVCAIVIVAVLYGGMCRLMTRIPPPPALDRFVRGHERGVRNVAGVLLLLSALLAFTERPGALPAAVLTWAALWIYLWPTRYDPAPHMKHRPPPLDRDGMRTLAHLCRTVDWQWEDPQVVAKRIQLTMGIIGDEATIEVAHGAMAYGSEAGLLRWRTTFPRLSRFRDVVRTEGWAQAPLTYVYGQPQVRRDNARVQYVLTGIGGPQ